MKKNILKIWKGNINKKGIKIITKVINKLDKGKIKIVKKTKKRWVVNIWIKRAIILYYRIKRNKLINGIFTKYYDKIENKFIKYKKNDFKKNKIRIVPGAIIRYGAFISENVIIMPSFINIGAYIGRNTLIDTWTTIGSCAYIGKNIHISGGCGIGGVLEPIQNNPVIIEKNCFIGARCEIAEGVIIKKNTVIAMGVFLSKSTKIYDLKNNKIYKGIVPRNSVIISGTLNYNKYSIYSAIIIKKVNKSTRKKILPNRLLRND